jgi:hypothetical protein
MPRKNLLALLKGGDRRSTGGSDVVATKVSRNLELFPELMAGLWSDDPLVRMRAADAAEKVTRANRELIQPYKQQLLRLMAETEQPELRWHLAAMIPRLSLSRTERAMAVTAMNGYLEDRSSIVKTSALQALADLAEDDAALRSTVIDLLRASIREGTPAMKARSRKLLPRLEGRGSANSR